MNNRKRKIVRKLWLTKKPLKISEKAHNPQNHTRTMSAEAEKAPEVAKEEEKTSEELKATKRAAEVSNTELRPAWALPQKKLLFLVQH